MRFLMPFAVVDVIIPIVTELVVSMFRESER